MLKKITTLVLLATLFLFWIEPASAKTFDFKPITDPMKTWTISFSDKVNEPVDPNAIYITSTNNQKHEASIRISADLTQIIVEPINPYLFGTEYTLVIPQSFASVKGQKLKEEVTMKFQLQGTHIQTISANFNILATNIIVQGKSEVAKTTVALDNLPEKVLIRQSNNKFSLGMNGLLSGDVLTIRAYDAHGQLLEKQFYEVK
ncbi:hypothetical protein [Sporosarcina sp. FSL K6-5500]|uniref:hypothetical protein n=1 Tax=Sporosarcina sp. FSL K6-5500 TaxID=2921558 RepID=UPI0030F563BD